jgi:hypothetical protein
MTTIVQSASATTSGTNETSLAVSFASLPSPGNSVIVIWSLQSSVALTGVADNQSGNTYVSVAVETSAANNVDSEIWWLPSISGSSGTFTVTGTIGTAHQISITIVEVAGLAGTDKTGLQGAENNTDTLTVTASGANTNANDLVVVNLSSGYTTTASGITAPTTGYTSINTVNGSNPNYNGVVQTSYKIVSAVETSSATWTATTAFNGVAGTLATFNGAPLQVIQSASSPFSSADPWPTSVSVTLSGVTAGNAILVVTPAVINTSGSPTLTITDTVNSVTDLKQLASFGLSSVYSILDFSIIPNASAGAHTLTATVGSGTGYGFIVAAEISGLNSSAALDVFSLNSAGGGSNPSTGNSGIPSSVNEIAIAAVSGYYTGTALTIGEPSGYTNIAKYQGGEGYVDYSVDYLTPVALSAQSASWTGLTGVNTYVAGVIVLKAASNQATVMWWS